MQTSALLLHWGSYRWTHNLWGLIIYLFFPPSYVPPGFLCGSKAHHNSAVRVFTGVWKLLSLLTPFPGWSSILISFVSLFIFYIFSFLLLKTMGCFSGCLISSASIQKLFCGIYTVFKCSFDEFVGGENGLPFLFLCHLRTAHSYIYFLYLNFKPLTTTPKIIWIMNMMNTYMNTYTEVIFVVFLDDTVMVFCFVSVTNFNCISVLYTVKCNDFLLSFLSFAVR